MLLLCYAALIISMQMKRDMPQVSSLTCAEKFLYFYMTLTASTVFIPDSNEMGKSGVELKPYVTSERWYLQAVYGGLFGLALLSMLVQTVF